MKSKIARPVVWLFSVVLSMCVISVAHAQSLDLDKQAFVGVQQMDPINNPDWVTNCMNLGNDVKTFGVKIVAYRILWSTGSWSGWFVPGVNDLYKKEGEPLRRYWATFNDHRFEIMYTADTKKW